MFYIVVPADKRAALAEILTTVSLPCPFEVVAFSAGGPMLPDGAVALFMGKALLDFLKELGQIKKNAALTSSRGVVYRCGSDYKVMISYDPASVKFEAERLPDIQWDLQLIARLALTGTLAPQIGNYQYIDRLRPLVDTITESIPENGTAQVAVDLETVGLDPYAPEARILSIGISYRAGEAFVFLVPQSGQLEEPDREALIDLVTYPKIKIVGANFKYDAGWMAVQWGVWVSNHKLDTHLLGSLLDENRSNSLNLHAKLFTTMGGYDDEFNRKYDKARMDLVLASNPQDFLIYSGGDADAGFRVANVFRRQISTDQQLRNLYVNLIQPVSDVFVRMEQRGVVVDRKRFEELEAECTAEMKQLEQTALAMLPMRLKYKYADDLSLSRGTIIRDFMFTPMGLNLKPVMFSEKKKDASVAIEHLEMFSHVPEAKQFVGVMRAYNSTKKTLDSFIVGFMKHIRSDGKFHPNYRLGRGESIDDPESGTVTGRSSATNPAWQTVPMRTPWATRLRSVYPAPPGMAILKADYSQGELRITACVSQEPTMLGAYATGEDLHSITAAVVMGIPYKDFKQLPEAERGRLRQAAKAVNFGLIYGMGPEGLAIYSRKSYGVEMSVEQATIYHENFFRQYSSLPRWHDASKAIARRWGHIRNPMGRIRHLPLITSSNQEVRAKQERQAVNSPVQSCLFDIMLLGMLELSRAYPDLWMFGETHDDLEMYVPAEDLMLWAGRVKETMENLPLGKFGWNPPIKFAVELEGGTGTLADLEEIVV